MVLSKACAKLRRHDKGKMLPKKLTQEGFVFTEGAIVDMYARYGFLEKAQEVFVQLPTGYVVIWMALIS